MSHVTHMNESCHTYNTSIEGHGQTIRSLGNTRTSDTRRSVTHERAMLHVCMSHGTLVDTSYFICECVTSHIRTKYVTVVYESCHTYK